MKTENSLQLSTLRNLALINSDKKERQNFCTHIVNTIEDGSADPLQVHLYIKNLESIFKTLTDEKTGKELARRYKGMVLAEAEKYGKGEFQKHNATFQIKEAGTKYDWSKCNDIILDELLDLQQSVEKQIKARQDFLKTIPDAGIEFIDQDSGEVRTIYKPAKSSTTTVSVSLT